MFMTPQELQERTLAFALAAYAFVRPLLRDMETQHVARQLLRASASAASNYRAAGLARSHREWLAKMGVAREEADESLFWLIYVGRAGVVLGKASAIAALTDEAQQLARIIAASYRTGVSRGGGSKRIDGTPSEAKAPPPEIDR